MHIYWYQIFTLDFSVVEVQEMFSSHGSLLTIAMYHHGETLKIKLIHYDETEKGSQLTDSQNFIKPQVEPRWAQLQIAPGTKPLIKALC